MAIYKAPIRDMQFVLHELLDAERCFAELPGGEEASADIIDAILEEIKSSDLKLAKNSFSAMSAKPDKEGDFFEILFNE